MGLGKTAVLAVTVSNDTIGRWDIAHDWTLRVVDLWIAETIRQAWGGDIPPLRGGPMIAFPVAPQEG